MYPAVVLVGSGLVEAVTEDIPRRAGSTPRGIPYSLDLGKECPQSGDASLLLNRHYSTQLHIDVNKGDRVNLLLDPLTVVVAVVSVAALITLAMAIIGVIILGIDEVVRRRRLKHETSSNQLPAPSFVPALHFTRASGRAAPN